MYVGVYLYFIYKSRRLIFLILIEGGEGASSVPAAVVGISLTYTRLGDRMVLMLRHVPGVLA